MAIKFATKAGSLAASFAGLAVLASTSAQPANAMDFAASGQFSNTRVFGTDPLIQQLAGGSFDGSYSVTGLPAGSGPVTFSSWLFNLRDGGGTVLRTLSNAIPGSSAFAGEFISPPGDFLLFADGTYQLQLQFGEDFTGIGPILPNTAASPSLSLFALSASSGVEQIQIESGASIPTPALLPGIIGMGVAALRRRKDNQLQTSEGK